jgi:hypothetical protein
MIAMQTKYHSIQKKISRHTIFSFRNGLTKEYEPQSVRNRATNIQN